MLQGGLAGDPRDPPVSSTYEWERYRVHVVILPCLRLWRHFFRGLETIQACVLTSRCILYLPFSLCIGVLDCAAMLLLPHVLARVCSLNGQHSYFIVLALSTRKWVLETNTCGFCGWCHCSSQPCLPLLLPKAESTTSIVLHVSTPHHGPLPERRQLRGKQLRGCRRQLRGCCEVSSVIVENHTQIFLSWRP